MFFPCLVLRWLVLQFICWPLDDNSGSFAADCSGAASANTSNRYHNIIDSLCGFDKSLVCEPGEGRLSWPTMQKYEKLEKIGEGKF